LSTEVLLGSAGRVGYELERPQTFVLPESSDSMADVFSSHMQAPWLKSSIGDFLWTVGMERLGWVSLAARPDASIGSSFRYFDLDPNFDIRVCLILQERERFELLFKEEKGRTEELIDRLKISLRDKEMGNPIRISHVYLTMDLCGRAEEPGSWLQAAFELYDEFKIVYPQEVQDRSIFVVGSLYG